MAIFTVWQFDSIGGAAKALARLERLQRLNGVEVRDAALVSWRPGIDAPATSQFPDLRGAAAIGGAFWRILFGLIFFVPLLGLAVGPSAPLAESLVDVGIGDAFVDEVRGHVRPGTSALFLLSSRAAADELFEELGSGRGFACLIHTMVSDEQEARLRESFAEAAPVAA
jgi:uncharacterized membrane protein